MVLKGKVAAAVLATAVTGAVAVTAYQEFDTSVIYEHVDIEVDVTNTGKVLNNVYEIVKQEYPEVATVENPTEMDKIKAIKEAGLLDEMGVFGAYSDDILITREMMLNLITEVVRDTGKDNVPKDYVCGFEDYVRYDDREIDYMGYNNLLPSGTDYYHGEAVPEAELAKAELSRFKQILSETEPVEKVITTTMSIEEPEVKVEKPIIAVERDEYTDNLFGNSAAMYKSPKNTSELNANLNRLNVGDPYSSRNDYNFINVDEGLLDYSKVQVEFSEDTDQETKEQIREQMKLIGLAMCELPNGISAVDMKDGTTQLIHGNLHNMGTGRYGTDTKVFQGIYLVRNNTVISRGYQIVNADGEYKLSVDTDDFKTSDYIMLLVHKSVLLDDIKYQNEAGTIGLLFKIDNYLKE